MPKKLCIYLLTVAIGLTCGYLFAGEGIEIPIAEPTTEELEQSFRDFQPPLLESSFEPCTTGECTNVKE